MNHYPQALVSLDALKDDPDNPQMHSDAEIQRLVGAIGAVGFIQPIAVDAKTMMILAGHGRAEAARLAGLTEVPALLVDDYDATKRRLALIGTNGNYGHFDDDALTGLLRELEADSVDLDLSGIEPFRLDELLSPEAAAGLTDPDEVPETPTVPITKRGQILTLGRHRLMCGDATSRDDVERLMDGKQADMMWTDPPYGVNYVGKTVDALTITNDDAEGLAALLREAFENVPIALKPGAAFYIAHPPGALSVTFGNAILNAGWRLHEELQWIKDSMVLGHSDYHIKHETIMFGYVPGEGRRGRGGDGWYGDDSQVSVFEVARPKASPEHPTGKPVDLLIPHINNSSRTGEVILDPFGGSGSTMIAAEQEGRRAYLMEIDPKYCDVIVARFEAFTGQRAERPTAVSV